MPRQDAGALQANVGYVRAALSPGSSRLVVEIAVVAGEVARDEFAQLSQSILTKYRAESARSEREKP